MIAVKTFRDVETAAKAEAPTEFEATLGEVKNMPAPRVFDLIVDLWLGKRGFADSLLDWCIKVDNHWKFMLLRNAANKVKDSDGEDKTIATQICISIVTKYPELILTRANSGEPTVLHIAASVQSPELVDAIFGLTVRLTAEDVREFDKILEVKNHQGDKTPLKMAVDNNLAEMVRWILGRNKQSIQDSNILKSVLLEGKLEVLKVMIELRPDEMTIDVVEHVLRTKNQALIRALQESEICHHLFENCGVLHQLVEDGDVGIIDMLLEKFPKLVLEVNKKNRSALSYNVQSDPTIQRQIREKIVPLIIRQIASVDLSCYSCLFADDFQVANSSKPQVSEAVRALIADPFDARKEISLSLGGYGSWASSAQSFLNLIRSTTNSKKLNNKPVNALLQIGFESTLIYIDIPVPDIPITRTGTKATRIRSEVWDILRWLKSDRGVKGIYELSVRDSCYLPHNEGVIRMCLATFDIEVLDWRRLDLSLSVLREMNEEGALICHNLKELRLYAGGWPALAYWTSDEGLSFLNRFQKLRKVEIFVMKEFVGGALSTPYRDEADARFGAFKTAHPETILEITIATKSWAEFDPPLEDSKFKPVNTAVEATQLGPFLEAYESLHRDFTQSGWRSSALLCDLDEAKGYTPYIKVAVIDNGVDPGSIDCHGVSGASFVPSETGESNWWYVKHPHGTKMARIITEINPHCRLLVAKIGETRTDFTASRVVKALKWAVAAGADVISLSLTLKTESTEVQIAINNATNDGVVVLASVNGEGANTKEPATPARYENVLAIGSANSHGVASGGTVEDETNFLFQGENIIARTEFLNGLADESDTSGPSVATAVAAGVASLVLACDRFALHGQGTTETVWLHHRKLRRQVVLNTFLKMTEKNRNYVRPWLLFAEDKSKPAWGEGDSVLDWIKGVFDNVLK